MTAVKVLVLGAGGREHALAWRLARDSDVDAVLCAPGNPGMAALGPCLPVDVTSPADVLALAEAQGVDLTVVGPEAALDRGVVDAFHDAARPIVGPTRRAAALESSKSFSKDVMARHGIPTARFQVCDDAEAALAAVAGREFGFPVVIKADGLAGGKGVVIAADRAEAETAVRQMMVDGRFGGAGSRVVIEECLTGPEVSFFLLCDGRRAMPLATAQDHKRIFDDDRGPNTGGMGAFAPSPLMREAAVADVMRRVVEPLLAGLADDGLPYSGFLYVSLMLTPDGPMVIEFNVRFGDPEAQVVLPLIEGPLAETLMASANGSLGATPLTLSPDKCVGVVLASAGYPGSADTGHIISGLADAERGGAVMIFHAGTAVRDGKLETAGGRVLTVVGRAADYEQAMASAYEAASRIHFEGVQYRRDIGRKAIG